MNRPTIEHVRMTLMKRSFLTGIALVTAIVQPILAAETIKPDITVATDGSGDFKTVQAAVQSIRTTNRERVVVMVKDGTYREKVRVDAPFVTLRGESRAGVRIEFPQLNEDFAKKPDDIGRAVINLSDTANDFVLENLTAENTAGQIGPHAFTVYGKADRTVILDCDVLSHGADTVSLWRSDGGHYYHARCNFRGSVDFICPRGWCYITDSTIYEMKATAAVWHDGVRDSNKKFVMRNCTFDGTNGWNLARHHHDAQFFFLDCKFSKTMIDRAPFRVIYPLNNSTPSEADIKRNKELDSSNIWGERSYFWNCHREGGDYMWHTNNLSTATHVFKPAQITALWTFDGKWNPENKTGPYIRGITLQDGAVMVTFSENVTVKGKPRLKLRNDQFADYSSGSGTSAFVFNLPKDSASEVVAMDLNGGAIIACEAAATIRAAILAVPIKEEEVPAPRAY